MSRSVFYGFPAFVGSFTSPTSCSFWMDDPAQIGWNSPQVTVDLAKNPESVRRAAAGQTAQTAESVQADDHASLGTGGMTRIGPMFPGGTMIGAVYLEQSFMMSNNIAQPGPRPYEWSTIQYYADEPAPLTNRRFYGFHAQIVSMSGTVAIVSLYPRGASSLPNAQPFGTWPIDLAQYGHPQAATLVQITAPGQAGPLYIDARAGGSGGVTFDLPKTPKIQGGIVIRGGRHAH